MKQNAHMKNTMLSVLPLGAWLVIWMITPETRQQVHCTIVELLAGNINVVVTLYAVGIGFISDSFDQQR